MKKVPEATKYIIYFDDTLRLPYSFELINDDEEVLYSSTENHDRWMGGQYMTKQAAASVAARMIKE
jgi:hypothetical protein